MRIIGVDPDTKGAVAILNEEGRILDLAFIPSRKVPSGKRQLSVVDPLAFCKDMIRLRNLHVRVGTNLAVVVERPNRGFSEAQPLGFALKHQNYGVVLGVLSVVFGEVVDVAANTWKARHKLKSDKALSLKKASELFPSHERVFALAKHHGYAEAALIAEWALHKALKEANASS